MIKIPTFLRKWGPAILMMLVIFLASSTPSKDMPGFGSWDTIVKKGGHMLGYALLALSYAHGLGLNKKHWWMLPWLLAILYAASDEFHQSFVPGRNATPVDVGIDTIGAGIGLLAGYIRMNLHRKGSHERSGID
jgi:VanZ family protein